jgi:hypothetical protein
MTELPKTNNEKPRFGLFEVFRAIIIAGAIVLVAMILCVPTGITSAHERAKVSRIKFDARTMQTDLDAYMEQNSRFPEAADFSPFPGVYRNAQTATLSIGVMPDVEPPKDPFLAEDEGYPLIYATDGKRFVIFASGPDQEYDTPVHMIFEDSFVPSDSYFFTYDPTNGTVSAGDVLRFSE